MRERAAHGDDDKWQAIPGEAPDRRENDQEQQGRSRLGPVIGLYQKPQIIGTQKTATTKNHSMKGRPNFQ